MNNILKDERPLRHNTPTIPTLIIHETAGDIASAKAKWIANLERYASYSNPNCIHAFFGKMTNEQVGQIVYKHCDHHLRQFNS